MLCEKEENISLKVSVIPLITSPIIRLPLDTLQNSLLKENLIADPPPNKAELASIDLVIGSDYYWDIMESMKIQISPGLY